eukprot:5618197-Pleurochrysis_carterae.AAC.1
MPVHVRARTHARMHTRAAECALVHARTCTHNTHPRATHARTCVGACSLLHGVGVVSCAGERRLGLLIFVAQRLHLSEDGEHLLLERPILAQVLAKLLTKHRDLDVRARLDNLAPIELDLASKNPQLRRLAGAVVPHKPADATAKHKRPNPNVCDPLQTWRMNTSGSQHLRRRQQVRRRAALRRRQGGGGVQAPPNTLPRLQVPVGRGEHVLVAEAELAVGNLDVGKAGRRVVE